MARLFHVADPEFWKFWRKYGRLASVEMAPWLGKLRLEINTVSGGYITLAGGMVNAVRLITRSPCDAVRVALTNAPRALTLVVKEYGIEQKFQGPQSETSVRIFSKARGHGGTLSVFFSYDWKEPREVTIVVHDEKPSRDGHGYEASHTSASLTTERLKYLLSKGPAAFRIPGAGNQMALPVTSISPSRGEQLRHIKFALPPEVTIDKFTEASNELLRFAAHAIAYDPKPRVKHRRAS